MLPTVGNKNDNVNQTLNDVANAINKQHTAATLND